MGVLKSRLLPSTPAANTERNEFLVTRLMRSIERSDHTTAHSVIEQLKDVNISKRERTAKLPTSLHQDTTSCLTTPVRLCISWREVKLLDDLFKSGCKISQSDKDTGLYEIFSNTQGHLGKPEIQIIRILSNNGAFVDVRRLRHLLKSLFDKSSEIFHNFMQVIITESNNRQRGFLLLTLYLNGCDPHEEKPLPKPVTVPCKRLQTLNVRSHCRETTNYITEAKRDDVLNQNKIPVAFCDSELLQYVKQVYLSGFNPRYFFSQDYVNFQVHGNFKRCMQAFPHFLQACPTVDNQQVTDGLYMIGENTGSVEENPVIRLLWNMFVSLGYDVAKAKGLAKMHSGFDSLLETEHPRILTLQECCRICIRDSIREPNVLLGVQRLDLPEKLKEYLLLLDVFQLTNQ